MDFTLATSFIFVNTYILVSTIDSTGDSVQVLAVLTIILVRIILKITTAALAISAIIMIYKLISIDRLNYLKIMQLAVSFSNLSMQASVT